MIAAWYFDTNLKSTSVSTKAMKRKVHPEKTSTVFCPMTFRQCFLEKEGNYVMRLGNPSPMCNELRLN